MLSCANNKIKSTANMKSNFLQAPDDLDILWLGISSTSMRISFLLKTEKKWCNSLKINKIRLLFLSCCYKLQYYLRHLMSGVENLFLMKPLGKYQNNPGSYNIPSPRERIQLHALYIIHFLWRLLPSFIYLFKG